MTERYALPLALIQLEVPPPQVVAKTGEQPAWFIDALQLQPDDYIIVRPHRGEALPGWQEIGGAILSGSWAMVTDHAGWSERTAAWIRGAMEAQLPLLGVCYGHQLMAYALGGEVGDNPRGWERGLQTVTRTASDPWLDGLPAHFSAWLSHRQSVLAPPPQATILACSAQDDCQVLRYSPQAFSVQFHPEFSREIMTACTPAGVEPDSAVMGDTDWARTLLHRFWQQVRLQDQAQETSQR
ncbi:glutamine amidotransferase [Pantoea sp. UBA4549]|uniref:glutamine amidotransferase n=1 Tax=Pantoea sp. UBA4549 TaxID=1947033 RepID=UPI0025D67C46|nr:glutamine amidotransferase [Pantoea sp. UBA4549]